MSNPKHQPAREIRKVNEIKLVRYGDTFGNTVLCCEPSNEDVQRALDEGNLEDRNYQIDLPDLTSEWLAATGNGSDQVEWVRQVKSYHARRVAFFVANGWKDPITITSCGQIRDGSHRIRAALFMDMQEVDVVVEQ